MKVFFTILVTFIVTAVGFHFLYTYLNRDTVAPTELDDVDTEPVATTTEELPEADERQPIEEIGSSIEERPIRAYHFGSGDREVLFIGGIHGGYSWNTSQVAYELIDHLSRNTSTIPEEVTVTVIPVMNPDGLAKVVDDPLQPFVASDVSGSDATRISGRFNAREIDLNRNFDCDWRANATWQNRSVSGGVSAFSEPESQAVRDYIDEHDPAAVIVWYSSAGGVFTSNCHGDVLPQTIELTNVYADASGYEANEEFDYYAITGDMVNWLAKEGVPAISVLLTDHQNTEWNQNRAGIEAALEYVANE